MDTLVLFDIDKTLIKSSTGHKAAFSIAFKKVYGVDTNIDVIQHSGMTDQQIIYEVLKLNGLIMYFCLVTLLKILMQEKKLSSYLLEWQQEYIQKNS